MVLNIVKHNILSTYFRTFADKSKLFVIMSNKGVIILISAIIAIFLLIGVFAYCENERRTEEFKNAVHEDMQKMKQREDSVTDAIRKQMYGY